MIVSGKTDVVDIENQKTPFDNSSHDDGDYLTIVSCFNIVIYYSKYNFIYFFINLVNFLCLNFVLFYNIIILIIKRFKDLAHLT